jgi:alkanesulfonate monooxygenase SsuD/methylene tetrahydromethanopterin reductase-like flavin-dependent oxidoreductase (luciferase family)
MAKLTLGVVFHPSFPPETLADFARRAEAGGFETLWLWDDCFLPGAFTAAAIALSATQQLKVGIGLLPATVYNPLFAAMEITTLARAFPNRFIAGFGHGVGAWMAQIGAAPRSSLIALEETVKAVRALLNGETLTVDGQTVHLTHVKIDLPPQVAPPIYVGAMREKSLRLAGRIGDGTLLTSMSSPAYVRWTHDQVAQGMARTGHENHQIAVYLDTKISPDGQSARDAARSALAKRYPWADVQIEQAGITAEVEAFVTAHGVGSLAEQMPDAWLDAFAAAGTPDQATAAILRLAEAGADHIILQPLNGDPTCLDEYCRDLLPRLR